MIQIRRKKIFRACMGLTGIVCLAALPCRFVQAQNSFVVAPGADVVVTGDLVLRNTSLNTDGTIDASAGNLVMSGGANCSIDGAVAPQIGSLTMKKTGGSTLTLNNDVQISGMIDFQDGLIDMNSHIIALDNTAALQAEQENSRLTGTTGGMVTRSAAGVNNPNQLDIGNLGASITSSGNLGNVTVSRMHEPAVNPGNGLLTGIQRTYLIEPQNNVALNATLRFYYFDAELGLANENTLALWKSTDGITWSAEGFDSRNTTSNYVEKTAIADFSYWTLADAANPLPLSLVYFRATCHDKNYVQIEWKTSMEQGLDYFEVEKAADGSSWTSLQRINASGNAAGASYDYKDADPLPHAFYKLKMTDRSGSIAYSPVFSGGCEDIGMPFVVYPNPAGKQTTASLSVRDAAQAVIQILNAQGAKVFSGNWQLQPGANQFTLPLASLAAGTYTVKVLLNSKVLEARLIKL